MPEITQALVALLMVRGETCFPVLPYHAGVTRAAREQVQIGLRNLPHGLLSKRWADLQFAHYQQTEQRRSGRKWEADVIKQLWLMSFKMWEHQNSVLHSDENLRAQRKVRQLNSKIITEHNRGTLGLAPDGQRLMKEGLAATLAKTHACGEWLVPSWPD